MRGFNLVLNPARDLFDWSRDMDRFLNDRYETAFSPAVDIVESEDQFTLTLDVPGLKKDEIKIEVHDRVLSITGERKAEKVDKTKHFHMTERSMGQFERRFTLPENVDASKVEATHADGILRIEVPKVEAAKPRLVEIRNEKTLQ